MPTRYRSESYQPAPSWLTIWKSIYSWLEPQAVSILQPIGFYEKYDIDVPCGVGVRRLEGEERAAIERIATALTIAAHCSHGAPVGIVQAWLERIAQEPALFFSKDLPPEVHWVVSSNYARHDEVPGTHLQDVFGRRRVRFETRARRPTDTSIAKAARSALKFLRRERGRPSNIANRLLAEILAPAFKALGGRVVRRQIPLDKEGGGIVFVEDGPFHHFLKSVIGPLQAHLKSHGLPGVTIDTVERIATKQSV